MKKKYIDRETFFNKNFVKCPKCGYLNRKEAVAKWGTCLSCKNVLDKRAKFRYDLITRKIIKRKGL